MTRRGARGLLAAGGVAIAVVAAMLFTGDGSVITRVDHTAAYTPGLVRYGARNGGLPVVIHGGVAGAADDRAIAAKLRLPARFNPGGLRATAASPGYGVRLLLYFQPQGLKSAQRLCGDPDRQQTIGPAPVGGRLEVFAVLCADDRWAARGMLQLPDFEGISDDRFGGAMAKLFAVMFTDRDAASR